MTVPFLGTIPFDSSVVKACDMGTPVLGQDSNGEFSKSLGEIVNLIEKRLAV